MVQFVSVFCEGYLNNTSLLIDNELLCNHVKCILKALNLVTHRVFHFISFLISPVEPSYYFFLFIFYYLPRPPPSLHTRAILLLFDFSSLLLDCSSRIFYLLAYCIGFVPWICHCQLHSFKSSYSIGGWLQIFIMLDFWQNSFSIQYSTNILFEYQNKNYYKLSYVMKHHLFYLGY